MDSLFANETSREKTKINSRLSERSEPNVVSSPKAKRAGRAERSEIAEGYARLLTYIINTSEDFVKYFHLFKKSAALETTPRIYLIGFDIEFICKANFPKSFKKSHTWTLATPKDIAACVIQIATEDMCMLINLVQLKNQLHKQIINIITSPSWVKAGVSIDTDLQILSHNYNLGHCSGGLELKNFSIMANVPTPNLEFMYNNLVGDNIKKSCSVCDWSKKLTKKQIAYAVMDAVMSYRLAKKILLPSIQYIKQNIKTSSSHTNINIINLNEKTNPKKTVNKINYVGRLNEYAQQNDIELAKYTCHQLVKGHLPKFEIRCEFNNTKTTGTGHSKKEAKKIAAKNMCTILLT